MKEWLAWNGNKNESRQKKRINTLTPSFIWKGKLVVHLVEKSIKLHKICITRQPYSHKILPPSSGVRTKDNSLIPSVCFFRHIYLALFLLWSGVVLTFCFCLLLSRFSFLQNTNQIQLKYNHPIYGFFHVSIYTCFYQEQRNQSILRLFSFFL